MVDRFRARRTAATPVLHLCASCGTKRPFAFTGVHMKTLTEFSGTMIRMAAKQRGKPAEVSRRVDARRSPSAVSGAVTAKPNENASACSRTRGGQRTAPLPSASRSRLPDRRRGRRHQFRAHTESQAKRGRPRTDAPGAAPWRRRRSGRGPGLVRARRAGSEGDARRRQASEVNADEEDKRSEPSGDHRGERAFDKAVSRRRGLPATLDRLREAVKATGHRRARAPGARLGGEQSRAEEMASTVHRRFLMPHR